MTFSLEAGVSLEMLTILSALLGLGLELGCRCSYPGEGRRGAGRETRSGKSAHLEGEGVGPLCCLVWRGGLGKVGHR